MWKISVKAKCPLSTCLCEVIQRTMVCDSFNYIDFVKQEVHKSKFHVLKAESEPMLFKTPTPHLNLRYFKMLLAEEREDYIEQRMSVKKIKESYVTHAEDLVKYKSTEAYKLVVESNSIYRGIYKKDIIKFKGKPHWKKINR